MTAHMGFFANGKIYIRTIIGTLHTLMSFMVNSLLCSVCEGLVEFSNRKAPNLQHNTSLQTPHYLLILVVIIVLMIVMIEATILKQNETITIALAVVRDVI